jgi:NADH dehydrogenase FAD-containing subunit
MNYFAWHLTNVYLLSTYKKQDVVLLGDGFFARGFLHTIDHSKFKITQIYRDDFINPQMITSSYTFHIRDLFSKKPYHIKRMDIQSLKFDEHTVLVNNLPYTYDHLVIGLGANKSLYEWKLEIKELRSSASSKINIVGMGPTGLELATSLAGVKSVHLYDSLPKEAVMSYLTPKGKNTVLQNLEKLNITTHYGVMYKGSEPAILCVGTQLNKLTSNFSVNDKLELNLNNRVHIGGDCVHTGFVKSAQVAYQQGVYVAMKLNGETKDPFVYSHKGMAVNIGEHQTLIEGHCYLPDGLYPDIVVKLYSLFCV